MIYYFSPFNSQKQIGKSHNEHCSLVINDDDWICITDSDILFLRSDTKSQIEETINIHGDKFQVFGCLTNRIASPHQQLAGFSENTDIQYHKRLADKCFNESYSEVKETDINVAGFLMIFQKKTWNKHKFSDNSIRFDSEFTDKVKADGGKLGIMQGVYVFHDYRLCQPNPMYYIDHLK